MRHVHKELHPLKQIFAGIVSIKLSVVALCPCVIQVYQLRRNRKFTHALKNIVHHQTKCMLSEIQFKAEYVAYLYMHLHVIYICFNNTENHSTFCQQVLCIKMEGKSLIIKSNPEHLG